ncbi:MAG: hypothetical protein ACI9LY_003993, partial [Arenicella sp.]
MTKTNSLNIDSETPTAMHLAKPNFMPTPSENAQVNFSKPSSRLGRWAIPALIVLASGCATQIKDLPSEVQVTVP